MTSFEEEASFSRFVQYVEDRGLRAYDGLVIQNASDIARESDRVRNETNWAYLQEKHDKKKRQEESIKRIAEDMTRATEGSYAGKHFRLGFMTLPGPQERLSSSGGHGFTVRSQSLHSVGGCDEDGSSRKQPPPKPKRDPNTKLSISSEGVNARPSSSNTSRESLEKFQGSRSRPFSEEYKRIPPPKPKRNPNTQLSTSFDDSYIENHSNRNPSRRETYSSQSQDPDAQDEDEPVYIEMVGNVLRDLRQRHVEDENQSEAVYEEMNYPMFDDLLQEVKCDQVDGSYTATLLDMEQAPSSSQSTAWASIYEIPAPFPNLLTHRPPLLVFPPAPAQCSPNSDESPLTPLDVSNLPMLENVAAGFANKPDGVSSPATNEAPSTSSNHHRNGKRERHREREREEQDLQFTRAITASGRSSAPPLHSNLNKASVLAHGYPRSHSACPSPVTVGRSLTPLSLKQPPPYDALKMGGSMPRSTSSGVQTNKSLGGGVQDRGSQLSYSSSAHSSMQKGASSRTPTSPLDELTNLLGNGKNMLKKESGERKIKNTSENEAKTRSHSTEPLPRMESKVHQIGSRQSPKFLEGVGPLGCSSTPSTSSSGRSSGRSSASPTSMLGSASTGKQIF
ncbi:hypothetical protein DPEC_G00244440 [Dallia pectoralis]|uniref:Uncharacterized protein n=1 Tax=Dallia pectoralis TaxID=75939 RepID=A0ACC2FVP9_DALPE|nr:hypothetical protein DPEC_G00244440 [Dallia pectoralis]